MNKGIATKYQHNRWIYFMAILYRSIKCDKKAKKQWKKL